MKSSHIQIKNINGNGNSNAEIHEFKVGSSGTDVREFNKLVIGSDKFTAQGNIRFHDIDEIEIRETSSILQLSGRLWLGDYSKVLDVDAEIIEEGDEEYIALSEPYHDGMTTADLSSAALWAQTGLDTFYEYEYCQGLPIIKSIRRQMSSEPDERVETYTYNNDCRLLTRRLGDGGSRIVYNA